MNRVEHIRLTWTDENMRESHGGDRRISGAHSAARGDHLDGKLYMDHVSARRMLLRAKLRNIIEARCDVIIRCAPLGKKGNETDKVRRNNRLIYGRR